MWTIFVSSWPYFTGSHSETPIRATYTLEELEKCGSGMCSRAETFQSGPATRKHYGLNLQWQIGGKSGEKERGYPAVKL